MDVFLFCDGGCDNYETAEIQKFLNLFINVIDQIQSNVTDDRLLLCAHTYDLRSEMKPSLVGEIFAVFKIS